MENSKSHDLLSNWRLAFVLFWLPVIAIFVTGSFGFDDGWRTFVWTAALAVMGAACIINSRRCGRVHCYLTGPFFGVMALITLLYGLGIVPLGRNGWNLIGMAILVGGVALCCLPELVWGKYRKDRITDRSRC